MTITKNFVGGAGLGGGSANNSTAGPGNKGRGAGIAAGPRYNPSGAGFYLRKSLIAQNGFPTNGEAQCFEHAAIGGSIDIVDQGYSLSWNGTGCRTTLNANPDLGLLGDHGGPTETIVPHFGSPALGAVPLASCDVTTDQRGFPRPGPDGTSCDIGAVEGGAAPDKTPTTMNLSSSNNPSKAGQSVKYTATVSPVPSSGTVAFTDGGKTIPGCGAQPRNGSGQYTCTTSYAVTGTHKIQAKYEGNTLFVASASSVLTQTVLNNPRAEIGKVSISGPGKVKKGKKGTFKVHVKNSGSLAASKVKVAIRAGSASDSKTIASIGVGKTGIAKFSIKFPRVGKTRVKATVTSANAGGGSASKTVKVKRR